MAQGSSGTISANTLSVAMGSVGQITWSNSAPVSITSADTSVATVSYTSGTSGTINITGVAPGSTTVTVQWQEGSSAITVTVATSGIRYLDNNGLSHFWDKIDAKKQNKLTAGSNITIAADNTISASQPTVNDATLTIQRNGTNVQTFTANASSNVTANISVPTKTSDLVNDGSDNTSTYIETDDAQMFAIGQGSTSPVFDEMTPVRTIEWDVSDATYRPIYQIANTGLTYINLDITVAYRITVTGTNIHSVTDIVDRWHNPVSYPITSMFCRTLSTSAATTGFRYLRAVYPVSAYLNNASYPLGTEIAMYNTTARHVKIEVFKDNSQVTWNTTKPSGPIYVSSTYNGNSVMNAYDTRGWRFRQPVQMYAQNAGYAGYISDFEAVNTSAGELKTGATALVAGHYAFLADDGRVYDVSNTAKNIAMGESKIGFMNSAVAANTAISYTYWRAISRPNATQVGYIPHDTLALGNRVFLRCTMDSNGNVHSDNRLSTTMSAGYTWMPFGWARSATTLYVDTRFPKFYTLDSNGKLTHIDGKEIAAGMTSVAWEDITNKPTFATVATSGSYNDLSNKPTIPTVNNATLTIQKNGTTVKTFTANASSDVTANITVPTKTSDITNDSNFVVSGDLATVATSGSYNDLANKPTVPEIKKRTGATTTTNITPLYVAGDGTTTPMALKTHGDDHTGSFAYVNINEPTGDISEAYIGGYVWDEYEDWWRKMSEKKLALYSDIPTVNNATLTIQKNGTTVKTFTANASSNVTANITVPTKTSELTNNSGFLTSSTGVTSVNGAHGAVTGIQTTSNLVTSVSSSSTNSQYPSAKLFYDTVGDVESVLQTLNSGTGV